MGFLRFVAIYLVVCTLIYVPVSLYARSLRRERLEEEWAREHPDTPEGPAREAFIEAGMQDYHHSLRRKLILLIYVIPAVAIMALIVINNWN